MVFQNENLKYSKKKLKCEVSAKCLKKFSKVIFKNLQNCFLKTFNYISLKFSVNASLKIARTDEQSSKFHQKT